MTKFKKVIACACAAVLAISSLAGCSGKGEKDAGQKKIITVWSSDRHDMETRVAQVEKFNAENPYNIEIKYEVKSDNMENLLKIAYQSNQAPDIHPQLSATLMKSAVDSNWIRQLPEDFVNKCKDTYVGDSVRYYSGNNNAYSITPSITVHKMVYNKDLFRECGLDPENPPKTWEQVREYAKIITEKGNGQKFGFALPMKESGLVVQYILAASSPSGLNNATGFDPKTNRFDFGTYEKITQFWLDMKHDGVLFPTPDTLTNDIARAQFAEGNIGMMGAASYDIGVYNDQFPVKIDIGVMDYPVFEGMEGKGGYFYNVSGGRMMNNACKYPEEQLIVYEWLMSGEILQELSKEAKGVYVHKDVFNKAEYVNKEKKGAVELSSLTSPLFSNPPYTPHQLLTIEGDSYANTIKNIIVGDLDVKATLDDLSARYNTAYDKVAEAGTDVSVFSDPDYNPISR